MLLKGFDKHGKRWFAEIAGNSIQESFGKREGTGNNFVFLVADVGKPLP